MKVDNTTAVPFNDKRNTVRISTKDRFAVGSVWIADMLHVPFGVNQAFAPVESPYSWWHCTRPLSVFRLAGLLVSGAELAQRRRNRHV